MKNVKQTHKLIVLRKKMKCKVYLFLLLICIIPLILGSICQPSGRPTIDRFVLLYDIVAVADGVNSVDWEVANVSSVNFSVKDESDNIVWSKSIPSGTSMGLIDVPIQSLTTGKYTVVLEASNSKGTTSDSRMFLVVGYEGLWYRFTKYVEGPREGPWYGFADELIPVSHSQGLNNSENVISVSEHVKFRHIKWNPDLLRWADREGCTSSGLNVMTIRQLNYSHIYDKGTEYPFPEGEWAVVGQYYCTVNWSPCNFGRQDEGITYNQVVFFIELEAIGL